MAPLDEILSTRQRAERCLDGHRGFLSEFCQVSPSGRNVLAFRPDRAIGEQEKHDRTEGATSTAFCLTRVLESGTEADALGSLTANKCRMSDLIQTAYSDFVQNYSQGGDSVDKDGGSLPNAYNSSIHLKAMATILAHPIGMSRTKGLRHDIVTAANSLAVNLATSLRQGFVCDTNLAKATGEPSPTQEWWSDGKRLLRGEPNWYLTYLITDALASWVEIADDYGTEESAAASLAREALEASNVSAQLSLARALAAHGSNARGMVDALELCCLISIVGATASTNQLEDQLSRSMVSHGLQVLLGAYLLADGSFAPKPPAFIDSARRAVSVASAEVALMLVRCAGSYFTPELVLLLQPVVDSVIDRSTGHRGWGITPPGATGTRKNSFSAISSWCFLSAYGNLVSNLRSQQAAQALGVTYNVTPPNGYSYPESLSGIVRTNVIDPIHLGQRNLASMSLVLHGAPGTAKTTFAKKLASDLGWPFLELSPARLLRYGASRFEEQTHEVFDLLPELTDVVVLLDEFESVLRDRASSSEAAQLLTTAMLPSLHRLRDQNRIVFIIATNHVEKLDEAAIRPGRIDELLEIGVPTSSEREQIFCTLLKKLSAGILGEETILKISADADTLCGILDESSYPMIELAIRHIVLSAKNGYNRKATMDHIRTLKADRLRKQN